MSWHRERDGGECADALLVGEMLRVLNPRETLIISGVFGLGGIPEMPEQDIALALGVSPPRVNQLKNRALERIRRTAV